MKIRIGVFALVLLFAAPAIADTIYYAPEVNGKRERSNIRHLLYLMSLTGDKKAIFDEYGYTPHRIRINGYGETREQWTYLEAGKIFLFDQEQNLVSEGSVNREYRRSWAYHKGDPRYREDVYIDQ
jgi:hypothetical protein